RHPAAGGDIAGGKTGERRGVEVIDIAGCGNQLSILVDDEDDFRVCIFDESIDDVLNLIEFLLVHNHLRVDALHDAALGGKDRRRLLKLCLHTAESGNGDPCMWPREVRLHLDRAASHRSRYTDDW